MDAVRSALVANVVHVWRIKLAENDAAPRNRSDWPIAINRRAGMRETLGQLLASYLNVPAGEVVLRRNEFGKPYVPGTDLHFNISHSGTNAICAFCGSDPVGVDIESLSATSACESIGRHYFSPAEYSQWATESSTDSGEAFVQRWTRKEAYAKACGTGLHYPFASFDASGPDRKEFAFHAEEPYDVLRWRILSFAPCTGFIGALAVRSNIVRMDWFERTIYVN